MRIGSTRKNAAILLLSTAASLILGEIAVRIFVPVRDVGPSFSVHDPYYGKRLKASFSAERTTPEFTMRLTTNSLGFRGPEPVGAPQRSILFLGDSFTLGYGVSDGEEFPARIAAKLQRRYGVSAPTVRNSGIGDSGNGYWVKLLRREGDTIRPRLVVMQLSDNDFEDNLNEGLFELMPDGSLRELPVSGPGTMRKLQSVIEAIPGLSYSYLVGLLRQVRVPQLGLGMASDAVAQSPMEMERANQLTVRLVEDALLLCESRRWPVLGILAGLSEARMASIRELFARHKVPFVVIPAKTERHDLYYRIDGHWHAAGHLYVAGRVLEALDAIGTRRSD